MFNFSNLMKFAHFCLLIVILYVCAIYLVFYAFACLSEYSQYAYNTMQWQYAKVKVASPEHTIAICITKAFSL